MSENIQNELKEIIAKAKPIRQKHLKEFEDEKSRKQYQMIKTDIEEAILNGRKVIIYPNVALLESVRRVIQRYGIIVEYYTASRTYTLGLLKVLDISLVLKKLDKRITHESDSFKQKHKEQYNSIIKTIDEAVLHGKKEKIHIDIHLSKPVWAQLVELGIDIKTCIDSKGGYDLEL